MSEYITSTKCPPQRDCREKFGAYRRGGVGSGPMMEDHQRGLERERALDRYLQTRPGSAEALLLLARARVAR